VSFSLQVKKLRRVVRLTHDDIYCTFLNEDRLILATLQKARGPASDRQITDSVTALCYLARNLSYRSLSQLEHNNIYPPEDALNTESKTGCENYRIAAFSSKPCSRPKFYASWKMSDVAETAHNFVQFIRLLKKTYCVTFFAP
jgi:hypothetical protein